MGHIAAEVEKREYPTLVVCDLNPQQFALLSGVQITGPSWVGAGDPISLKCFASASDSSSPIEWFTNGDRIDRQSPGIEIRNTRNPVVPMLESDLVITRATMQDTGEYVCRHNNHLTKITVQVLPDTKKASTYFANDSLNVTVVAGGRAILPCAINNLGRTNRVVWLNPFNLTLSFNDRRIIDDSRISVERPFVRDWNLHIRDVKSQDEGLYRCMINTTPPMAAEVRLFVQEPPQILTSTSSPSRMEVDEGSSVVLECDARGTPTPIVTWYRINDQRRTPIGEAGERLVMKNVTRYNSGAYECSAANNIPPAASRTFVVQVNFPPEVTLPKKRLGQFRGRDTDLECMVTGNPKAIVSWSHNGQMITPSEFRRVEMHDEGIILHLMKLKPGDFGVYECVARNALGEASGSMHVYEVYPPTSAAPPPTDRTEPAMACAPNKVVECSQGLALLDPRDANNCQALTDFLQCVEAATNGCPDVVRNQMKPLYQPLYQQAQTMCPSASSTSKFEKDFLNVTVLAGSTAVLPCAVKDLGDRMLMWVDDTATSLTLNNQRVVDDTRISVERPSSKDWNLRIKDVTLGDQGVYRCVIDTQPPSASEVRLFVQVPPNATEAGLTCNPERVEVCTKSIEQLLVLTDPEDICRFVAKLESCFEAAVGACPDAVKESMMTTLDSVVSMTTCQRGMTYVDVSGPESVETGQPIVLNCTVDGGLSAPNRQTDWYKDGERQFVKPGLDIMTKITSEGRILSRLRIERSTLRDSGTYVCQSAGERESFNVNVQAADEMAPTDESSIMAGSAMCQVEKAMQCAEDLSAAPITDVIAGGNETCRKVAETVQCVDDAVRGCSDDIKNSLKPVYEQVKAVCKSVPPNATEIVLTCSPERAMGCTERMTDLVRLTDLEDICRVVAKLESCMLAAIGACPEDLKKNVLPMLETALTRTPCKRGMIYVDVIGPAFVETGQPVALNCTVDGGLSVSNRQLDWYKDGERQFVKPGLHIMTKVSSEGSIVSTLRIQHATMRDSGTYVCQFAGNMESLHVNVLNADKDNVKRGSVTTPPAVCAPEKVVECTSRLQSASPAQDICTLLNESVECIHAAVRGCPDTVKERIMPMLQQLNVQTACGVGGSTTTTPEPAACRPDKVTTCTQGMADLQLSGPIPGNEDACKMMNDTIRCVEDALRGCPPSFREHLQPMYQQASAVCSAAPANTSGTCRPYVLAECTRDLEDIMPRLRMGDRAVCGKLKEMEECVKGAIKGCPDRIKEEILPNFSQFDFISNCDEALSNVTVPATCKPEKVTDCTRDVADIMQQLGSGNVDLCGKLRGVVKCVEDAIAGCPEALKEKIMPSMEQLNTMTLCETDSSNTSKPAPCRPDRVPECVRDLQGIMQKIGAGNTAECGKLKNMITCVEEAVEGCPAALKKQILPPLEQLKTLPVCESGSESTPKPGVCQPNKVMECTEGLQDLTSGTEACTKLKNSVTCVKIAVEGCPESIRAQVMPILQNLNELNLCEPSQPSIRVRVDGQEHVEKGRAIELNCSTEGDASSFGGPFLWYKDGDSLLESSRNQIVNRSMYGGSYSLFRIENAREEDSGTYVCHFAGTLDSLQVTVLVGEGSVTSPSPGACQPEKVTECTKELQTALMAGPNACSELFKSVACVKSAIEGCSEDIQAQVAPMLQQLKQMTLCEPRVNVRVDGQNYVDKGQPIELNCTVEGDVAVFDDAFLWYKDGDRLLESSRNQIVNRSMNGGFYSIFRIENAVEGDSGSYVCHFAGALNDIIVTVLTDEGTEKRGPAVTTEPPKCVPSEVMQCTQGLQDIHPGSTEVCTKVTEAAKCLESRMKGCPASMKVQMMPLFQHANALCGTGVMECRKEEVSSCMAILESFPTGSEDYCGALSEVGACVSNATQDCSEEERWNAQRVFDNAAEACEPDTSDQLQTCKHDVIFQCLRPIYIKYPPSCSGVEKVSACAAAVSQGCKTEVQMAIKDQVQQAERICVKYGVFENGSCDFGLAASCMRNLSVAVPGPRICSILLSTKQCLAEAFSACPSQAVWAPGSPLSHIEDICKAKDVCSLQSVESCLGDVLRNQYKGLDNAETCRSVDQAMQCVDSVKLNCGDTTYMIPAIKGAEQSLKEMSARCNAAPTPLKVQLGNVTARSLDLSWDMDSPADFTLYKIWIRSLGPGSDQRVLNTRKSSFRVGGRGSPLTPGTGYVIRVVSVGPDNKTRPWTSGFYFRTPEENQPYSQTAMSRASRPRIVAVQEGDDATLKCYVKSLAKGSVVVWTNGRPFNVSSSRNDGRYSLDFQAPNIWTLTVSNVKWEDQGRYRCFVSEDPSKANTVILRVKARTDTTLPFPPAQPAVKFLSLRAVAVTSNSILVSAVGPRNVQRLKIMYSDGRSAFKRIPLPANTRHAIVGKLKPNTLYYFSAKAKVNGRPKKALTHAATLLGLKAPNSVSVEATRSNVSALVTWAFEYDAGNNPLGFTVDVSKNATDGEYSSVTQTTVFNSTNAIVQGLKAGDSYRATVTAFDYNGLGCESEPAYFQLGLTPGRRMAGRK